MWNGKGDDGRIGEREPPHVLWLGEMVVPDYPPPRPRTWKQEMIQHRAKAKWASYFHFLRLDSGIPTCEQGERRIVLVELHHRFPAMDRDNRNARMKVILDALQRSNLIWDDRESAIDLFTYCVPTRDRKHTVIRLARAVEATG